MTENDRYEGTGSEGGCAFPTSMGGAFPGLSYVDYMAGQALIAFGAQYVKDAATRSVQLGRPFDGPSDEVLARYCYRIARAMNQARQDRVTPPHETVAELVDAANEAAGWLAEHFDGDHTEAMGLRDRLNGAAKLGAAVLGIKVG